MEKKPRYLLIDSIRGLAVVNMVIFHFLYDYNIIYGQNASWYWQPTVRIWQQAICWTFIFVAGFVWQWGQKGSVKRGLLLNFWGLVISLVTWLVVPQSAAWFGILNFIGCAVLLTLVFHKAFQRIPPLLGMAGSFFSFLLFYSVEEGFLGLWGWKLIELPQVLYRTKFLTPIGFPYPEFVSSDYFPILPWIFLFWAGYFFSSIFMGKEKWHALAKRPIPCFSWAGRWSLFVYLLHQPLAMLLCEVLL